MLVLTSYVDDEHVISALNKGADGYEMKDVEPQKLINTILQVLNDEKVIHPEAKNVMASMSQNHILITNYLREKLKYCVKWLKVKRIKK